jgi:hypothetical protein
VLELVGDDRLCLLTLGHPVGIAADPVLNADRIVLGDSTFSKLRRAI